LGFPVLFETALPAMRTAAARGLTRQQMLLDTLFQVMAVMEDSNLAHRGGLDGLHFAQRVASGYLAEGGAARPDGVAAASEIGHEFVSRRLSPGGAADTLSAACLVARITTLGRL
jgi:triphosphoribosyl-dephospho-CoA synthase